MSCLGIRSGWRSKLDAVSGVLSTESHGERCCVPTKSDVGGATFRRVAAEEVEKQKETRRLSLVAPRRWWWWNLINFFKDTTITQPRDSSLDVWWWTFLVSVEPAEAPGLKVELGSGLDLPSSRARVVRDLQGLPGRF